jgi:hypothetical protein
MKRSFACVAAVAMMVWALPASAQTAAAPTPSGPSVNLWYIGAFAGASSVENVGALAGAEVGIRATKNLDVFVEGGWMQDVVTRRRLQSTDPLVSYLQTTRGTTASATVEAPAFFGGVGLRWVFEREGALRPYISGSVGMASVEYKPSFTLGGTDITASIKDYGITLGQDIQGREKKATLGGGLGVLYVHGAWYLDAGVRLTSIQTKGQKTNVSRAALGFGLRF